MSIPVPEQRSAARSKMADLVERAEAGDAALDRLSPDERQEIEGWIARAEDILRRISNSKYKALTLLRELVNPQLWQIIASTDRNKRIMQKANPIFDYDNTEHTAFVLSLSDDGRDDIERVEIVESFEDVCDTLFEVASAVHAEKGENFADLNGIDAEDDAVRRLAGLRWAADVGGGRWRIRKARTIENKDGRRERTYSTQCIDDELAENYAEELGLAHAAPAP